MFNTVEKHQKLVKVIMFFIMATFVVWGVGGYLNMGNDDGYIAKVSSKKIYKQDVDQAIEQNPQAKQNSTQVLFGLINRQLLINNIADHNMGVATSQLQQAIAQIPVFQVDGKFNFDKYREFLEARYTTSEKFEQDVQQQLLITTFIDFFKNSYFSSQLFEQKFALLLSRQRNISQYKLDIDQFYQQVKIAESDTAAFYKQNVQQFTSPEQAKVAYLVLSQDAISNIINVTPEEINKYKLDHPDLTSNKIDVSHILFSIPANADAQQKAQIKVKAEKVLNQVQNNPTEFAKLAIKYSEDPGSAKNGGDLGFFGKGVMAKPFETAAFKLKKGQISGLVETQFGYHILKLNEIKNNDIQAFNTIVVGQIRKQKAQKSIQAMVDKLNDLTYNQANSLEPAAKALGLTIQTSEWISKNSKDSNFTNPKVLKAIFSKDTIVARHNSEVVDMGDGSYRVFRITEYQGAKVLPLNEVHDKIVEILKKQLAAKLVSEQGQKDLQSLQNGNSKLNFANPQVVTLFGQNPSINPMSIRQIFATNIAKLPAYTGIINNDGSYVIYQINGQSVDKTLVAQNQKILSQMANQYAVLGLNVYVGSLRDNYSVNYKIDRLQQNASAAQ